MDLQDLQNLDARVEFLDHLCDDVSMTAVAIPLDAEHRDALATCEVGESVEGGAGLAGRLRGPADCHTPYVVCS